ncbi:phosphoribosylamine--glycine ligase [Vagococcus sp.]|uniref:phosphoribosylamine--glycine ligase n=1 Tax=Vagococcus sp. TaxID=1933889 RepID=UPI003F9974BC
MKILVIGSGGREHALAVSLLKSPEVSRVFCAKGNPGMHQDGIECVPIEELDFCQLITFCQREEITYTIVGPELPLSLGIVDAFQAADLLVFGPTKQAAQLEASKDFAKQLMKKYQIPTANFATFTSLEPALVYLKQQDFPTVVKEDGLAAGKGVTIVANEAEGEKLLIELFAKGLNQKVVIEEFLVGKECSLLSFVSEKGIYPMITARDHKAIYDGNRGPNTGGMGAFSPIPEMTEHQQDQIIANIVEPTVAALAEEGITFTGILYTGLMLTSEGAKVIEYNARFGDPETQVLLQQLDSDLALIFKDLLANQAPIIKWKKNSVSLGVVIAAKGYPLEYEIGSLIPNFIDQPEDIQVFYAGVAKSGPNLIAAGGRILLVTTTKEDLSAAHTTLYQWLEKQPLDRFYYRGDLGK